ncbi:MAG: V-type ATP synthase subunit E [Actinobacteria bacterium]|nr:V-type ATP synthase subunit E [Actinomycetota bacterium]
MPLEQLIARIMNDARESAEEIMSSAVLERSRVLREAEVKAEQTYRSVFEVERRAAEGEKEKIVAAEALEARKELLKEKRAIIEEAFDRAMERLTNLPDDEYVELLERMMVEAAGDSGGEVIMSPGDRERLGAEVVERANRKLAAAGKKGSLTLSDETREIFSGFVLRRGGVEMNSDIEALMRSRREDLERKPVEILFG